MIKKLDKENLPILRSEIDIALQPIADKYGIKLSAGNVSFSEFSATFKLEVATAQDGNHQRGSKLPQSCKISWII